MRSTLVGIVASLLAASSAVAFSGAEFLNADANFSDGYAWGALESRLMLSGTGTDTERQSELWSCIGGANVSSRVFGDAVRNSISNDAKLLTDPAIRAVILTLNEMCPDD